MLKRACVLVVLLALGGVAAAQNSKFTIFAGYSYGNTSYGDSHRSNLNGWEASIEGYRSHIDRLGLGDRVRWHGASAEVAPWYAVGDLFVMPTQYEAFPLVVVESLASGLPVITTAVAGSSEAIQPDVNGLLQRDPDDVDELVALLEQGLDGDRRRRWSDAAPETVRDLEWGVLTGRLAAVIEGVTGP